MLRFVLPHRADIHELRAALSSIPHLFVWPRRATCDHQRIMAFAAVAPRTTSKVPTLATGNVVDLLHIAIMVGAVLLSRHSAHSTPSALVILLVSAVLFGMTTRLANVWGTSWCCLCVRLRID